MPGRNTAPVAALTLTLLLTASAGADAATFNVDPKAAAGCAGNTCQSIGAALAKAGAGDTISVARGLYVEDPLDITKANLTIEAAPGTAAVSSKGGADVVTISADGVTLRGLNIGVQEGGGSSVVVKGAGAVLDGTTLTKQTSGADVPAVRVQAPSGFTTFANSVVVHAPKRSGASGVPAIQGPPSAGLIVVATQIVSGPDSGPALAATGSTTNIVRAGLLALRPDAPALRITSPVDSAFDKAVVVDSTALAGGVNSAGLRAETIAGGLPSGSNAGDINVTMTHATIAGSVRSVEIDAAADGRGLLGATPKGDIAVTAARSIIHGAASVQNHDAELLGVLSAANTASLAVTDSDTNVQPFNDTGSTVSLAGAITDTPDSALFADPVKRRYLLRHDAPVRDKGGPVREGEADKDLDGESRLEGPATDLGADEFHNKPPVARLNVPEKVAQGTTVKIDASKSEDPEGTYGGGIKEYYFDFGDGQTAVSTTPVVEHAYPDVGSFRVRVAVVDVLGLVGAVASSTLQVTDGVAPEIKIAQPKNKATFALKSTKRVKGKDGKTRRVKRARSFRFQGTASDAAGVESVELSFKFGPASGRTCRFLDHKKQQIVGRPCTKPLFFRVAIKDGIWAYRTKKTMKLRVGNYLLAVRATDKSGVAGIQRARFRLK